MSTISASTTSTTAFKITTDTTGALVFQTGASPTTAMTLGSDQSVTFAGTPTYSGGTANGVAYLNGSKVLTTGTALVFDGTNLGVGVTPSAWRTGHSVIQLGGGTGLSLVSGAGSGYGLFQNSYLDATTNRYLNTGAASSYYQFLGGHYWSTAPSGTAGNSFGFTQVMTLDASGNLGVGVTSVGQRLEIGSSGTVYAKISSSTNSSFRGVQFGINGDSNTYGSVAMEVNGGELRTTAGFGGWGGYQTFYTNGAERARIDTTVLSLTGLQGIKFQATQSASSDANTLDDYEEGTWTVATNGSSNLSSITFSVAKYIKVGRLVQVQIGATYSTSGSGNTYVVFSLPFAMDAAANTQITGTLTVYNVGSNLGLNTGCIVDNSSGDAVYAYGGWYVPSTATSQTLTICMTYQAST